MELKRLTTLTALLAVWFATGFSQIDYKGFPEWGFNEVGVTQFYLYTPADIDTTQVYPIALFLHGCCGENNNASLRNCVDPPVRMWHNFGKNTQKVPTYIISPATSSGWSQHFTDLKWEIDDLIKNHHGDSTRVYITGFSMGGRGTFDFINTYPDLFAAALPMGMSFSGSMDRAKNIPIWANIGELDGNSGSLSNSVAALRALNGDPRGSDNRVTGVNPRLTVFTGVDHGVQWAAASTQDLVGWAMEHVRDGNAYPNVYFASPEYGKEYSQGAQANLEIVAGDNDGTIDRVDVLINDKLFTTLTSEPYNTLVDLPSGDIILKAVAYDNLGKKSTAILFASVDSPPLVTTKKLPYAIQGALYDQKINVSGNAGFTFSVDPSLDPLPDGIKLMADGTLRGIPVISGEFNVQINVLDHEGDFTFQTYELLVKPKRPDEVIITNLSLSFLPISKLHNDELPSHNNGNEISISDVSKFGGLTFFPTQGSTSSSPAEDYLSFDIDEDATVYIAYETIGGATPSTIPQWLETGFTKLSDPPVVAQYRYYNVYAKTFTKGRVTLSGPAAQDNGVPTGYFVMVKKSDAPDKIPLEMTTDYLPCGYLFKPYDEQIATIGGQSDLTWNVLSGALPGGLSLNERMVR